MMRTGPCLRMLMALAWLSSSGCTTIRELPRDAYASRPERKHVVVTTRDGREQEFDRAHFGPDTLTGYLRLDGKEALEEFTAVPIPLDDIVKLSSRRVDWYRTGLVGGAVIAAIVAVVVSSDKPTTPTPTPPDTCTTEPCLP